MKELQCTLLCLVLVASSLLAARPSAVAESLKRQTLGAGTPIVKSTVTLWESGENDPSRFPVAAKLW